MNIEKVQKLIDLYWEGATSQKEEEEIRTFFLSESNLPSELEKWRDWFMGKDGIIHTILDKTFDQTILSQIEQSSPKGRYVRLKRILVSSVAIASIVILVCLIHINYKHTNTSQDMAYIEARENYETIKELLYFTSSKMNQTETMLEENLVKIDVINEYIK